MSLAGTQHDDLQLVTTLFSFIVFLSVFGIASFFLSKRRSILWIPYSVRVLAFGAASVRCRRMVVFMQAYILSA